MSVNYTTLAEEGRNCRPQTYNSPSLLHLNVVLYPTVTSEDVCLGINQSSFLQHGLLCHVCNRSLYVISVSAEMAELK